MASYKAKRRDAIKEAERYLAEHVIVEEPVRSFRFHAHHIEKSIQPQGEGAYPFRKVFPPIEKTRFAYSSIYAFTLTWTPGHMTIVGDLGELTVVHYHAMRTLEEACNWLQSPDLNYLLSKTNVQKEYDPDETLEYLREWLNEEVIEACLGHIVYRGGKPVRKNNCDLAALREWRRKRPSEGALDEFSTVEEWLGAKPEDVFSQEECNVWDRWRTLKDNVYSYGNGYEFTRASGRRALLKETRSAIERQDKAIDLFHELGLEDYYGCHEYRSRSYFQIAAIQHGCRMILQQLEKEKRAA